MISCQNLLRSISGSNKRYTLGEEIAQPFPHGRRSAIHCRHCRSYRSRCHLLQRLGRCKLCYFRSFSYHTLHHVNPLSRYHQSESQKVFQDNGSQHHFLPHRRHLHTYHPCALERCVWLGSFRNRLGCAAILGIVVLNSIDLEKFRKPSVVCYIAMGWVVIIAVKPMIEKVYPLSLWFILIGGLFYTVGVIFYVKKSKKYFHSIWHLFTIAGSVFHYFAVLMMITHE